MKIQAILRTSSYRGDHSADVSRLHEIKSGETVEELFNRLMEPQLQNRHLEDWIELRPVAETNE